MYTLLRIDRVRRSPLSNKYLLTSKRSDRPPTYPKIKNQEPEDACLVELMNEVLTAEA